MGTIIKIAKHIITKINVAVAFNGLGIFVVTIVSEIYHIFSLHFYIWLVWGYPQSFKYLK